MSTPSSQQPSPAQESAARRPDGPRTQTDQLKRSAKAVEHSTRQASESADRRTELAADRTIFAAERTYAAWVRTGLASLASGIGVRAVLEDIVAEWLIMATATVLVMLSAFCFIAGIWRHLQPGIPPEIPKVRRLPAFVFIGVNTFLVLVALAALYGIWHGDFSKS